MNIIARSSFAPRQLRGLSRLHDDIDRIFGSFFSPACACGEAPAEEQEPAAFMPGMDLASNDKFYAMHVELPGVLPENIAVKVEEGVLTVSGEKKEVKQDDAKKHVSERVYGKFTRSLTLPEDADADAISAKFKDGVLAIEIPRKAPEKPKAKCIEIAKG